MPNTECNERRIFDLLHTLGLNVEVKTVAAVKGKERLDLLTSEVGIALKDHNSPFGLHVVQHSFDYCRNLGAIDDIC